MEVERIKYFRAMTSDTYVQSMLDECLDEIEQLQAQIKQQEKEICKLNDICVSRTRKLQAENSVLREAANDKCDLFYNQERKIEQLQAELKTALLEIELIKHVNRWIPVSERLPEDGELYLLTKDFDKGEDMWLDIFGSGSSGFKTIKDYIELHKITHWKPVILPEDQ